MRDRRRAVLRDAVRGTEEEKGHREDLNRYPEDGGEKMEKRLTPGRLLGMVFFDPRAGKTNPKTAEGILSFRGEEVFRRIPGKRGR